MLNSQMSYAELSAYLVLIEQENCLLGRKELGYIATSLQDPFLQQMLIRYPLPKSSQTLFRESFDRHRLDLNDAGSSLLTIHGPIYGLRRQKVLALLKKSYKKIDDRVILERLNAFIKKMLLDQNVLNYLESAEVQRYEQRLNAYHTGQLPAMPTLYSIDEIVDDFIDYLQFLNKKLELGSAQVLEIIASLFQRVDNLILIEEKNQSQLLLFCAFDDNRTVYHDKQYSYIERKNYGCLASLTERLLDYHVIIVPDEPACETEFVDQAITQLIEPFIETDCEIPRPFFSQAFYKLYLHVAGYEVEERVAEYFEVDAGYNLKALQDEYLHVLEKENSSCSTSLAIEKLELFLNVISCTSCEQIDEEYNSCIHVLSEMGYLQRVEKKHVNLIPPESEKSEEEIINLLYESGLFIDKAHLEMVISLHGTDDILESLRSAAELGICYDDTKAIPSRDLMIHSYKKYLSSIKYEPFYHFVIPEAVGDILFSAKIQLIRCSQTVLCELLSIHMSELEIEQAEKLAVLSAKQGYASALRILCQQQYVSPDYFYSELKVSLLSIAALAGHTETVNVLIELGATLNNQKNHDRMTALMFAISMGHLDVVRILLKAGIDINLQSELGGTAVIAAVRFGYMRTLEFLLTARPNVDLQLLNGETALTIAAENDYHRAVKLLISQKASLNIQTESGWTAVMCAASNGATLSLAALIEARADLEVRNSDLETALILAAKNGHTEAVISLLNAQVDINAQDSMGNNALYVAVNGGHSKITQLLLEKGRIESIPCRNLNQLLGLAIAREDFDTIEILIDFTAGADIEDATYYKAIRIALIHRKDSVINRLLDLWSNINFQDESKNSVLHWAAIEGDSEVVRKMLANSADFRLRNNEECTPLMLAVEADSIEIVELLINAGAKVNVQDNQGNSPLTQAALTGCADVVRILINAGANTDFQNACGDSAVIIAAREGHLEVVNILYAADADLELLNDDSESASIAAANNQHKEIVDLLISMRGDKALQLIEAVCNGQKLIVERLIARGVDIDVTDSSGITALMYVALSNDAKICELLINARADLDLQHKSFGTALIRAAMSGHDKIVQMLIAAGANLNLQNSEGLTALMVAIVHQHFDIAIMLIRAKSDLGIQNAAGETVLMLAAGSDYYHIVDELVKAQAPLSTKNAKGQTALRIAFESKYQKNMAILRAAPNMYGAQLVDAVINGDGEKVRLLIKLGANVNYQHPYSGNTALMYAVIEQYSYLFNLLINANTNIQIKNKNGETALDLAELEGNSDAFLILTSANLTMQIEEACEGKNSLSRLYENLEQDDISTLAKLRNELGGRSITATPAMQLSQTKSEVAQATRTSNPLKKT